MNDGRTIPPAAIAVGTGWDVSSLLAVPTDLLKRATRERKYVIERIQNHSRDESVSKRQTTLEMLYRAREDLERIGSLERHAIRMAMCRAEYIMSHVLSTHAYFEGKKVRENSMYVVEGTGIGDVQTGMLPPQHSTGPAFVDVLVQDYVARHGYTETLSHMVDQEEMMDDMSCHRGDLVDGQLYEELNRLVAHLEQDTQCHAVLAWCTLHQAKLKKMQSSLLFQLHVQEFVQILRSGGHSKENKAAAIQYAKTHLSPYAKVYPDDFQRAASLLVLHDSIPDSSTCVQLLAETRWNDLASQLRREFFTLHGLALSSPLETHLKAGIASLKTPESMHDYDDSMLNDHVCKSTSSARDNPLRHPVVHMMATALPYAKRTVSKLVCPVTGMIMEGANAPMVLPNGYVYGQLALDGGFLECRDDDSRGDPVTRRMVTTNTRIQCPCTGSIFSRADVRRAYVV